MDIIIGGSMLTLLWTMVICGSHKLTLLSINVAERIKPGIWYNRPIKNNAYGRENISLMWGALLFMAGAWYGMIHIFPFLMFIARCKIPADPLTLWIAMTLLMLSVIQVVLHIAARLKSVLVDFGLIGENR